MSDDRTFIDLGLHHAPHRASDRIVFGFNALRHGDVDHGFAYELAGQPLCKMAECPPHAAIEPMWMQVA